MHEYWHRQDNNSPLYEEIVWAKPENKRHRKRLVIVGGNTHAFMQVAASYDRSIEAGIGDCRVVLPDKLEKVIGKSIENVVYLPSDSSGGISKDAITAMHQYSEWGDGILFPGELGHGSETTRFAEQFINETKLPLVLSGDSIEVFFSHPKTIFDTENAVLMLSINQLQKMAPELGLATPVTHKIGLVKLVELLQEITENRETMLVTNHESNIIVAMYGEVSTTPRTFSNDWQLSVAPKAAVYLLQHPEKPFQAVTTSVLDGLD